MRREREAETSGGGDKVPIRAKEWGELGEGVTLKFTGRASGGWREGARQRRDGLRGHGAIEFPLIFRVCMGHKMDDEEILTDRNQDVRNITEVL
ncbi:hypothetical protein NDU88_007196 [Pleurodeles waltl]|uniref:Uncharacterized protein n=1 Tax=Pleurodeles waltl TaxID=8319 RepID=A0AAV7NSD7_PLEWA|nr:hypothetical protein NDU88_007196 [Pleurodeles waltl]